MKVRARRYRFNTEINYDDFKLKEFSKDKEIFIPDLELSCCDCSETEDLSNHRDSGVSFLVKYKADNLSDPSAVKDGVRGFQLPAGHKYQLAEVESHFRSIKKSHYNLMLNEQQLEVLAEKLYASGSQVDVPLEAVSDYLRAAYIQEDWQTLLRREDKTKWAKFIRKCFKDKYKSTFGQVNRQEVREALEIDPAGFRALAADMKSLGCFDAAELKIINSAL